MPNSRTLLLLVAFSAALFGATQATFAQGREAAPALPRETPPTTPYVPPTPEAYRPPEPPLYVPPPDELCSGARANGSSCGIRCLQTTTDGTRCDFYVIELEVRLDPRPLRLEFKRLPRESGQELSDRVLSEAYDRLLAAGGDLSSYEAQRILAGALANGNLKLAKKLLAAGATVDRVYAGNALLLLIGKPDKTGADRTAIAELLRLGVNVNKQYFIEDLGIVETPLAVAIGSVRDRPPDPSIVEALLASNADVNQCLGLRGDRKCPIHMAVEASADRVRLVKMLLAAGANPNQMSYDSDSRETALSLVGCNRPDSAEVISTLRASGARTDVAISLPEFGPSSNVIDHYKKQNCQYKKEVLAALKTKR